MSIITAKNLGLSFGSFDLFQGISIAIANEGKIGLIGPNGIGKTSLLLILAGITQPSRGDVTISRGKWLGYLRQEAVEAFANRNNTVYDEMSTVFAGLQSLQVEMTDLEEKMASDQYSEDLLERYGNLQHQFESAGGYDYDLRIQQTLDGLELGKANWQTPLNHLSGGQKTRALLARLLLEKPDLLMLDEPTNHLDIDAVEWLEKTLHEWQGAILIVSHDRYFLDNTVNTIWEMNREGIETYSGNYSAYLLQRQERWDYHQRTFNEEKDRLLKEVDFIQRNWVRASTHDRALGRLRRLTRDLAVIDHYGIQALRSGKTWRQLNLSAERPLDVIEAIRKVNGLSLKNHQPPAMKPRLSTDHTSGTIILRLKDVTIGFPSHPLFSANDVELRRGECAALIGPNGSGKTTFLKVLLGQIDPLKGSVSLGASLKIGYFAQAQDALDPDNRVIDELIRLNPMQDEPARSYLAQYLFRGDDVFKPVAALSGGERTRLALAIMALEGANLLLLDEPTNHLDIEAREALQGVLESYSGTVLLVSHDRYLIDRLATQVWDIREGKLLVYQGSYHEYLLRSTHKIGSISTERVNNNKPLKVSGMLKLAKPLLHGNSKETRLRAQLLARLEDRIKENETTIQRLSVELQKIGMGQSPGRVQKLGWDLARAQATLDTLMAEWEKEVSSEATSI